MGRKTWAGLLMVAVLLVGASQAEASTTATTGSYTVSSKTVTSKAVANPAGGGACKAATYALWIHNAWGMVLAKIWNHSTWCYHYGGAIYFRSGYTDVYTAPAWSVSNVNHYFQWPLPSHTVTYSHATAHFYLEEGGYVVQQWNPDDCEALFSGGNGYSCR